MTISAYLKRPLRKYEQALSDVEKARKAERDAAVKTKRGKKRPADRQRPAA